MSAALAHELHQLYVARIYPVLAQNDPAYQRSLVAAGLGWTGQGVPSQHRDSFTQEMKMQAWLAATKITEAASLDPSTVRTKLIEGSTTLFRISQSGSKSPPGIWWFSDKVAQRCRDEAGPDPQKRLEWLRNVLAVCFNWSRFDRIERCALHAGESIPAVIGRGLPMPYYKVDPYIDRQTGERKVDLPLDYWQKMGQTLFGGELQTVLPWIPVQRIKFTASL